MDTAQTDAERILLETCGSAFDGFGIVYSFSPIFRRGSNRTNRRQLKETRRLSEVVSAIEKRLTVNHDADNVATLVKDEGFGDCITITTSSEGLVAAIAERLRARDNAYDHQSVKENMFRIGFWHDESHR
jgi:hypothetical protein